MRETRRIRLLLSITLIAALGLIALNYHNGSSSVMTAARNAAGTVLGGTERAVSTVTGPVGRLFGSGSGGGQAAALRRKLVRMRAQLSAETLSKAQYRQLTELLGVAGTGGYRVVAASVIAFGQGYQQTVTLDAGRADGVRPQQTVLDGNGLVGQVLSVNASTCTVLLATDASSVIGVRLAPSGKIGWVTGQGPDPSGYGLLKLQVLDPTAVLTPGEQLVTAASVHDQPFVPGVPIGVIASVRNQAGTLTAQALVRPYADLTALDIVGIVIAPPRHDPHFAVLPPKPTPAH
ncbi:MAG TPA: rod shape-determining protein MreC [Streptosporangiaceae bacterium]|nr:rod shape-determining protein MreC [Streptosporangiaceae bacterium]